MVYVHISGRATPSSFCDRQSSNVTFVGKCISMNLPSSCSMRNDAISFSPSFCVLIAYSFMQDRGTPQKNKTTTLAISVIDNDDLIPKFTQDIYRTQIFEFYPLTVSIFFFFNGIWFLFSVKEVIPYFFFAAEVVHLSPFRWNVWFRFFLNRWRGKGNGNLYKTLLDFRKAYAQRVVTVLTSSWSYWW